MKKIISIVFLFSGLSPISHSQPMPVKEKDLEKLASLMAGEFSSEEQSKTDTSFFHIKLRMKPIQKISPDGYWLYVEQSVATSQDKPYRQRIYHLFIQDDTTLVSKVYEIKHPEQYTGGWNDEAKLKTIAADSLIDRQGCGIYLHKKEKNVFSGSTPGKECLSVLRGASYATSEVTIYKEKLVSWDRGWDKNDKQVWGARKSGYIFIKRKQF